MPPLSQRELDAALTAAMHEAASHGVTSGRRPETIAVTRKQRSSIDDSDRLRKYLGRFGLDWVRVASERRLVPSEFKLDRGEEIPKAALSPTPPWNILPGWPTSLNPPQAVAPSAAVAPGPSSGQSCASANPFPTSLGKER